MGEGRGEVLAAGDSWEEWRKGRPFGARWCARCLPPLYLEDVELGGRSGGEYSVYFCWTPGERCLPAKGPWFWS